MGVRAVKISCKMPAKERFFIKKGCFLLKIKFFIKKGCFLLKIGVIC
jgi:hypothetical protein